MTREQFRPWRVGSAIVVATLLFAAAQHVLGAVQQSVPGVTAEEMRTYSAFRTWITSHADLQAASEDVVIQRYRAELRSQGKSETDIDSAIAMLRKVGDRAEVEMWNRVLTNPKPTFNTSAMGQGRNTIYLAQQGWDSVGFDPADRAVAAAQDDAKKLGVKITTQIARAEDFAWGENQWDLIVLCYVGGREYVSQVTRALRPGGMVVVEAFHRDATRNHPIGGAVVFDTNELVKLFEGLRVVRYEDTNAKGDFGLEDTRVVRLAAVKP
jgi:SAM-dependent methyltransferase